MTSLMEMARAKPDLVKRRISRLLELGSHREFVQAYYEALEGSPFNWGRHHPVICETLDRVLSGEITRLIINIPPRYSKTDLATIMLSARAMAKNPRSKMMHLSYSDALVRANSVRIKAVMQSEAYQGVHGINLKADNQSKWVTEQGGEFYAVSTRGQVTGMGAGREAEGFQGAIIIDDPIKPEDANHKELKAVNARYHNTIKSRAFPPAETPIIIIMQRVHYEDLSGHLLMGGSGEKWHHLCLPIEIDAKQAYPDVWTHGIPIEHNLEPGPLWERIHNQDQIDILKHVADVYAAQYAQRPNQSTGGIFQPEHFHAYSEIGNLEYRIITADTAQKDGEENDYTVMQCWGKRRSDAKAILLDQDRGHIKATDLRQRARTFWAKHKAQDSVAMGTLRSMDIEDKVSGTQLIQDLVKDGIPVIAIPREKDKVMRANDVVASFGVGLVEHPPEHKAPWVKDWKAEMLSFPHGLHDDQCDPTFDAVAKIVGTGTSILDNL